MLKSLLVIAIGASLGAWTRWGLGVRLNSMFPTIPPGTVAANFIGGYIIGLALGFFSSNPSISLEWRLLVMAGFCGGNTDIDSGGPNYLGAWSHRHPRDRLIGHDGTRITHLSTAKP